MKKSQYYTFLGTSLIQNTEGLPTRRPHGEGCSLHIFMESFYSPGKRQSSRKWNPSCKAALCLLTLILFLHPAWLLIWSWWLLGEVLAVGSYQRHVFCHLEISPYLLGSRSILGFGFWLSGNSHGNPISPTHGQRQKPRLHHSGLHHHPASGPESTMNAPVTSSSKQANKPKTRWRYLLKSVFSFKFWNVSFSVWIRHHVNFSGGSWKGAVSCSFTGSSYVFDQLSCYIQTLPNDLGNFE